MRRAALLLLLLLVAAPAAYAANGVLSFTVTTTSPLAAPGITLTGDDQSATFSIVTQITYTGNQNQAPLGWTLKASATQPTNGTTTLPAFQVTNGTYTCTTCSANPDNPISSSYPITLSGTAQTIFNASPKLGRGVYNLTNTFEIDYPGGATKGTYSATVTLTASTPGP